MAVVASTSGPGCEAPGTGMLAEPVSAVTSLAFVLGGLVIVMLHLRAARQQVPAHSAEGACRLRGGGSGHRARRGGSGHQASSSESWPPAFLSVLTYAVLVAGIGVGSFIQHGPDPSADLLHDLPLLATLAFVAADSLAVLTGRPRAWWWWAAPSLALVPLILLAPRPADLVQAGVAAVAVVLTLARALRYPGDRRAVGWAVALLAVGSVIGTLSRAGWPLCDPHSLWQGHAAWHVLASLALVVLAPVIDRRPGVTTAMP